MSDQKQKDAFGGYGFAIRTFWCDALNLRVFRGWSRDLYSDTPMKSVRRRIRGTAISTKDDVRVIGSDLKTKEFIFSLASDESAAENWQRVVDNTITKHEELVANKARRFEIIQQRCKEKAPTAFLGYTEKDWEIGNKSEWWLEALVPEFVMSQLEQDISLGLVKDVHVGIEWIAGLVDDQYAPPSVSLTWGLLKEDNDSPESLKGYVTSVGWNIASTSNDSDTGNIEYKDEEEIETIASPDPTKQSIILLCQAVTALSNRITSAFVITAILIVIAHFLR